MAYRPPLERRISILHPSPRLFPVSAALLSAALPAQAAATPAAQGRTVTLRPGPLATALTDLARQAGWQLLFDPALVRGRSIKRATRAADAKKLLDRVLRDNALEARWLPGGTLLIVPRAPSRAPPPAAEADNQPVIVTALKRETVMAETPLSMSVERGNVLADRGVHDIRTLARRHPELSVVDTGTGQQRLLIRGLASAGEPTVGIYYDESAISGPGGTTFDPSAFAPDLDLVDIDRVELLRGPQGTLYGASAMGGVVRVIFNQPDPTAWHGEARAGVEQTSGAGTGGSASLMLNAPIVADQLAVRMSLYARRAGGVIRNDHLDLDHGGRTDKSGARFTLAWTPQDGTSIQGSAIVQRTRISDAAFWYRAQGRNINDQSARTPQRNDLTLYNLTARHDLGGVTALATVSHYTWNIVREIDYTGSSPASATIRRSAAVSSASRRPKIAQPRRSPRSGRSSTAACLASSISRCGSPTGARSCASPRPGRAPTNGRSAPISSGDASISRATRSRSMRRPASCRARSTSPGCAISTACCRNRRCSVSGPRG